MTQPIWYDSSESGAPTLNNAAGSMIEVLRTCLVNGFGAKAAISVVVASGVATLTCAAHGFTAKYGKLLHVAGCTEAALNGLKQPTSVTTNELTYDAPGVADGSYGGSIMVKRPGLGWAEEFNWDNVSVFKRLAPDANAQKLLIKDSNAAGASASDARVQIVETATSVSDFTGVSPAIAGYWTKGLNSATAKKWAVVGDEKLFWLFVTHATSAQVGVHDMTAYYFGDLISFHSPDPYSTAMAYATAANPSGAVGGNGGRMDYLEAAAVAGLVVSRDRLASAARNFNQGGPRSTSGATTAIGGQSGSANQAAIVIHEPVWALESDGVFRGEIPGLAAPLSYTPFNGGGQLQLLHPVAFNDVWYLVVLHQTGAGQVGSLLINLTEWRR